MTEQEKLAYLAGLFDGEGTFSIQVDWQNKQYVKARNDGVKNETPSIMFNPRMTMTLHHGREVLLELQNEFGGQIYHYEREDRYNLSKLEPLKFATESLIPYLRIKKNVGERFLEALNLFPSRKGIDMYHGGRVWTPELVSQVACIALTLNPESARKSPKTIEYLEELKKIYE